MNATFRTALTFAAIAASSASLADRTPPAGTATLYGDWSIQNQVGNTALLWTNKTSSTRIAWTQDSYGIVEKVHSSGNFSFASMKFWGLKWNVSDKRWASFSGDLHFEGGGVEMPMSGGMLSLGDLNGSSPYLTSSQTWTGPESGRAHFAFGHDNYSNYYKVSANGNWCPEWTLEKGMNVWLTWTNQFTKTDVTVKYPARIWLEKKWTTSNVAYEGGPALRAKTLTLSGDGVMWEAGGTASYGHKYKTPELEPEMNSVTVSPSLTLKDGADLLGRSGGWNIPTLAVTGTGESAFDGSWKFRRATTDVSIASGAVLALTGDVAEGDVPAGLDVTGAGELKLNPSTFRLTGDLTLGANVTLVLAGHGEFSHRINGGKEIRIESDGNDITNAVFLTSSALAGFTGSRVVIASGKAFVDAKEGVTIVEDGGTLVDLTEPSADPWIVTDAVRAENAITVGSGETLYVYGNGLTAAPALTLNGGRVAFMRSATVGSAITVLASSSIGAESAAVVGTILGKIEGSRDSGTMQLNLSGAGTINLAGGCDLTCTHLYVREGSANLMSNRFDFAYSNVGVYEGDYLGIRDGARIELAYPASGGILSILSRPREYGRSIVEICSNATVVCNQNTTFSLGRWSSEGVLRMSGGSLTIIHGTQVNVGYNNGGIGLFEMNDGLFQTDQAFRVGAGARGSVVWRGGRIKLRSEFWTYAGNGSRYFDGTSSNLTFTIAGPDCVLDLNGAPAFTNVVANSLNAGSWRWEDGGRLTVTNGGTFVMNRFPANGRVAVKDCSLLVADAAEPAIGELGFAGTTNDVISAADGLTLAAQGVRVLSGGEWGAAQVEGISWSDLAFDTGAVFRIPMTDYDTVATCSIPGTLTLGDALGFNVVRNGYRFRRSLQIAVVHAAGGVTGNPSCTPVERRKGLSMFVSGDNLVLDYVASGMVISYR